MLRRTLFQSAGAALALSCLPTVGIAAKRQEVLFSLEIGGAGDNHSLYAWCGWRGMGTVFYSTDKKPFRQACRGLYCRAMNAWAGLGANHEAWHAAAEKLRPAFESDEGALHFIKHHIPRFEVEDDGQSDPHWHVRVVMAGGKPGSLHEVARHSEWEPALQLCRIAEGLHPVLYLGDVPSMWSSDLGFIPAPWCNT